MLKGTGKYWDYRPTISSGTQTFREIMESSEFPPNIDNIRNVLKLTGNEIFAWDGVIHNPGGGMLSPSLIAHETIHFKQQNGDPADWWNTYLNDIDFRLTQELEAHRSEYRTFCRLYRDRNKQAKYLFKISGRLSSSLYGNILTHREAMRRIK